MTGRSAEPAKAGGRGPLAFVSLLLAVEAAQYSSITPLLAHYVGRYALSTGAAGLLVSSYAGGAVVGSVVASWACRRVNPRAIANAGLALLAAGTVAFGLTVSATGLMVARGAQGLGGGVIWAGGLLWLLDSTPVERRARAIGTAFAWVMVGGLAGPVIGSLALAVGPGKTFAVIGLGMIMFLAWSASLPSVRLGQSASTPLLPATHDRGVLQSVGLLLLPSAGFGAISVLLPIRLSQLGASGFIVGATFLIAAAGAAGSSVLSGRISDRRGPFVPMRAALLVSVPVLLALAGSRVTAVVAVSGIAYDAASGGLFTVPAVALLVRAGERCGAELFAPAATMVILSAGEVLGGVTSARLAQATTLAVPLVALAALSAGVLALLGQRWFLAPIS